VSEDLREGGRDNKLWANQQMLSISPALAVVMAYIYLLCGIITETRKGNATFALFQIRLWSKIMVCFFF